MSNDPIRHTLSLKNWAVVGASDDPARYGYKIWRVLRDRGYVAAPIHPRHKEIDGEPVYRSLRDLPSVPDVVDMVVNPATGIRVMEDIRDLGIRHVWMQPGTRSDEIRAFAEAHGITLIEDCVLVRIDR